MEKKYQLSEEELVNVSGGKITFTWSSTDNIGTIGIDDNNCLVLLDKDAFLSYYSSVKGTMSDGAILKQLVAQGIAKKP